MKTGFKGVMELFAALRSVEGLAYMAVDWGQIDQTLETGGTHPVKYPALLISPDGGELETLTKDKRRERQQWTLRLVDAPGVSCTATATAAQQAAAMRLFLIADEVRQRVEAEGYRCLAWRRTMHEDAMYEIALSCERLADLGEG